MGISETQHEINRLQILQKELSEKKALASSTNQRETLKTQLKEISRQLKELTASRLEPYQRPEDQGFVNKEIALKNLVTTLEAKIDEMQTLKAELAISKRSSKNKSAKQDIDVRIAEITKQMAEVQLKHRHLKHEMRNDSLPISSLSGDILLLVLDTLRTDAHQVLLLSHVFRRWRDTILQHAPLWCNIEIKETTSKDLLALFLSRSGECPLSVSLSMCDTEKHHPEAPLLLQLLRDNARRLRQFYISPDGLHSADVQQLLLHLNSLDHSLLTELFINIPWNGTAPWRIDTLTPHYSLGAAPALTTLRLTGWACPISIPPLPRLSTLHLVGMVSDPIVYSILQACPLLEILWFSGGRQFQAGDSPAIQMTHLRHLRIGHSNSTYQSYIHAMLNIQAPVLESFTLSSIAIPTSQVLNTFFYSSLEVRRFPQLRCLALVETWLSELSFQLEIMQAVPHLAALILVNSICCAPPEYQFNYRAERPPVLVDLNPQCCMKRFTDLLALSACPPLLPRIIRIQRSDGEWPINVEECNRPGVWPQVKRWDVLTGDLLTAFV